MKFILKSLLSLALLLGAVPVAAEEIGDTVSTAAPKGTAAIIPPGEFAIVAKYLDQFLATPPGGHRTIYADILMDGKDDPILADELKDFYLLDIRTPAEFCKDTVPGAVNIPLADIAKAENLAKLPLDKPILLICNTGHTSSVANMALGALGYNAWTLRFGMMSWRLSSPTKVWTANSTFAQAIIGANLPVKTCY